MAKRLGKRERAVRREAVGKALAERKALIAENMGTIKPVKHGKFTPKELKRIRANGEQIARARSSFGPTGQANQSRLSHVPGAHANQLPQIKVVVKGDAKEIL